MIRQVKRYSTPQCITVDILLKLFARVESSTSFNSMVLLPQFTLLTYSYSPFFSLLLIQRVRVVLVNTESILVVEVWPVVNTTTEPT